jgi:hypothetical protein
MDSRDSVKTEFLKQFAHTWRVFGGIVGDFDPEGWIRTGRGAITPARLSFHLLKSVKYYLEDSTVQNFESGKSVEQDWTTAKEEDLPSQRDVLACIGRLREINEQWLRGLDFDAPNSSFPWAGESKMGVVLFLLRHTLYHLGELSSLLNECRRGIVEDHYVKAM